MNRKPVRAVAAVLAVLITLGVLAALEKVAHFEYQRAASAADKGVGSFKSASAR